MKIFSILKHLDRLVIDAFDCKSIHYATKKKPN